MIYKIKDLVSALTNLPDPTEKGQVIWVRVPERTGHPYSVLENDDQCSEPRRIIQLVAVVASELEWSLEIKS